MVKKPEAILVEFGQSIAQLVQDYPSVVGRARIENPWFTEKMTSLAAQQWANMLKESEVKGWLGSIQKKANTKLNIGIIMAGNIPFVGLHDLLSVVAMNQKALCKLSSSDTPLMKWCIERLWEIEPQLKERIRIAEDKVQGIDALIATGSDNSARYFEYYFKDIPKVIRKNRSSVAIVEKTTSTEQLKALADDIFMYYGLGCRNVGKVYLPSGFQVSDFIDQLQEYEDFIHHHKYANNYTYHKAILLMNLDEHLDNGFLILQEKKGAIKPPLSTLFYEFYEDKKILLSSLMENDAIQCVVGEGEGLIPFGKSQFPELNDYADQVNTLEFLTRI